MALSRVRGRLIPRLRSRRTREREGLVLVEGVRSASDALSAGAKVRFAVVSDRLAELADGDALRTRLADAGVELVELPREELASLSDTATNQGILLVCDEPVSSDDDLPSGSLLVLDGIQDPGNVGTLIRAAAAFGVGGTVVLDGTADPFSPKTVRAAAGAVFRSPLIRTSWDRMAPRLHGRGPLLVADMAGPDVAIALVAGDWALVVGSEGAGPRESVRAAATGAVSIPMPGGGDSLNAGVAGAILLYALTRVEPRV